MPEFQLTQITRAAVGAAEEAAGKAADAFELYAVSVEGLATTLTQTAAERDQARKTIDELHTQVADLTEKLSHAGPAAPPPPTVAVLLKKQAELKGELDAVKADLRKCRDAATPPPAPPTTPPLPADVQAKLATLATVEAWLDKLDASGFVLGSVEGDPAAARKPIREQLADFAASGTLPA